MPLPRGAFFVLEGIDRTGKSTHSRLLVERLIKELGPSSAVRLCFPDRTTPVGSLIDGYLASKKDLDDRAVHLLFSANRWEAESVIRDHLAAGRCVVTDRYAYSGVAFTSAKGLDREWCKGPDRGLPRPDAVFYLDLDPAEAAKRGQYGEERYEKEAFQQVVAKEFAALRESDWIVVDAARPQEAVHEDLVKGARDVLVALKGEVGVLWPIAH